jgi:hypothetical protein
MKPLSAENNNSRFNLFFGARVLFGMPEMKIPLFDPGIALYPIVPLEAD